MWKLDAVPLVIIDASMFSIIAPSNFTLAVEIDPKGKGDSG